MARDRSTLGWGLLFLMVGSLWLLKSIGLSGRLFDRLLGTLFLLAASAFLALVAAGKIDRRYPFLIPAGILAALGIVNFGKLLHLMPRLLESLLVTAGVALPFALIHRLDTRRKWALWCMWIAILIGALTVLDRLGRFGNEIAGIVFLWGAALPFAVTFLRRGKEWALVTAGVLASAGLIPAAEAMRLSDRSQAALFLLGLAATFAAVHVLGRPGRVGWARIAAIVCGSLGLLVGVAGPLLTVLLPLALIGAGAWLVFGTGAPNGKLHSEGPPSPPPATTG